MSGWEQLRRLDLQVRPIDKWPGVLRVGNRPWSRFSASLADTLELLARELRFLGAKQIVLQAAFRERDIRLDGLPRATARPDHPGLILAFESKFGPLQYATDEYRDWEDNLRAIALSLEALRKVDRYGVSKRGEQYRGWRALTTGTDPADQIATQEQAEDFLAEWDGDWRRAAAETHPDRGGDPDRFRQVMKARELLVGA